MKIPKIIHQTFKTKELPDLLQESVNQLKEMNPDFEYRFYDDEDCINFIRENYDEKTLKIYLSINPTYGSARADLFRYLLMYKVGGVYLDIKSSTSKPLSQIIKPKDEYILCHWPSKVWNHLLDYPHGEFQQWHIICVPNHPFLKKIIENVKINIFRYGGQLRKQAVLELTGPIVYTKSILSILNKFRVNAPNSPVRQFFNQSELNLVYRNTKKNHKLIYKDGIQSLEPIVYKNNLPDRNRFDKAYVLFTDKYNFDSTKECVTSIRSFSNLPIIVYTNNSNETIDLENTITLRWNENLVKDDFRFSDIKQNFYNRDVNNNTYDFSIQKPLIIKHALMDFSNYVAFIDNMSIATKYCDKIFDFYKSPSNHPFFVEVIKHVEMTYRQSKFFVAGTSCLQFLDEWYRMCSNENLTENQELDPSLNEDAILNILLRKKNIKNGIPLIYVNSDTQNFDEVNLSKKSSIDIENVLFLINRKLN